MRSYAAALLWVGAAFLGGALAGAGLGGLLPPWDYPADWGALLKWGLPLLPGMPLLPAAQALATAGRGEVALIWVHNGTVAALLPLVSVTLAGHRPDRASLAAGWPLAWAFAQGLVVAFTLAREAGGSLAAAGRLALFAVLPHGGLELGALLWAAAVAVVLAQRCRTCPGTPWRALFAPALPTWAPVLAGLAAAAWIEAHVTPVLIRLALG